MTYTKRTLGAFAASAVALPFFATGAQAAPGDTAVPPRQEVREFCTNPTFDQFTDVRDTDVFALDIRCIASGRTDSDPAGITRGAPGTTNDENRYGPELSVTRGQMASFIARAIDAADARDRSNQVQTLPPASGGDPFTDVPDGDVHQGNIQRLADADIVEGGVGGEPTTLYSPEDPVSRAQMASFINRAAAFIRGEDPEPAGDTTGFIAPENADYYDDDEDFQVHEPNINGITSVGIAQGTGGNNYNARSSITRAQMSGFIGRSLAQFYDDARIFSILEPYTNNLDQTPVALDATPNPDGEPTDDREFDVTGLEEGREYRITLVREENVSRDDDDDDLVEFVEDADTGLAATGSPTADITTVNGAPAENNAGEGEATTANDPANSPSAVAEPDDDGTITFTIDGDEQPENVVAVLYHNGNEGNERGDGGESPRLELDDEGHPIEFFGISGVTEFVEGAATGTASGSGSASASGSGSASGSAAGDGFVGFLKGLFN